MIQNYFKIAWRNLMNNKSSSLINISGLAIGIAVCLMIFTIIQFETSFEKHHKNEARVYRVLTEYHHENTEVFYGRGLPYAIPEELKNSFPEIEKISAIFSNNNDQILVLDNKGTPIKRFKEKGVFFVEPELFDILDYEWLAGTASSLKDPNNVVLAKETAEKYFDTWQNALGKTIKWNDREILTVTGILGTIPSNTDLQFKAVISYGTGFTSQILKSDSWNGTDGSLSCYILLPPSISENTINARLKILSKEKKTEKNIDSHIIQSLSKVHYGDLDTGNYIGKTISRKLINVLWVIGAFILLIACVNFVNLSTAQAINRSKEVGVRKVLGSTKAQLKAQFLMETFLIVIISIIIAVFIVFATQPFIGNILDLPLTFSALLNLNMLFVLFGSAIIITLFAGFYPSIVLAKFNPITALKNQTKTGNTKGITLRRSLVVFQFAIAQVLIIGTLIIVKQMDYFTNQSMGYNKDAIVNITFPTDSVSLSKVDYLNTRLLAVNGIQKVSFSSAAPTEGGNSWTNFKYNNATENTDFYAISKGIDSEYLSIFELPLIAGRNINKSFANTEFIVNEKLIKSLVINDYQEVLNKEIRVWGGSGFIKGRIVGVIKDYHTRDFTREMDPVMMTNQKDWYRQVGVKLGTSDISSVISSVEKIWNESFPNNVFEYQFLDTKIAKFYAQEKQLSQMYQLFALIAILLSCLGLYGLASFMATQRTKEVGIRKVLGASISNIIYLFSKEFIILIAIGFAIAAPIAWYFMNEWLLGYVYRIDMSWLIFMIGGILSMIVALATVGFQALKAAIANPVNSLKTE